MTRSLSVEVGIDIPMRDGAMLAADVYRPSASGPVPAIVVRTPYNRRTPASRSLQVDSIGMAEDGYAVVVQDVRGRFASEGGFVPFVHEQADGVDTILWAADQQWCDGRVGMAGISYLGYCQLAAAAASPEPLLAIVPGLTPCDIRSGWIYEAGVFNLGLNLAWMLGGLLAHDARVRDRDVVLDAFADPCSTAAPASGVEQLLIGSPLGDTWSAWTAGPELYEGLDEIPTREALAGVTTPALVLAGWFDVFGTSTMDLHTTLEPTSSLLVGPWGHTGLPLARREGARDHGPDAAIDLAALQRSFYDRHLRDSESKVERCRVFTTGVNRWEHASGWPPEGKTLRFFPGRAGRLDTTPDRHDIRVDLDVSDPTPSAGGRVYGWEPVLVPGPFDQRTRDGRSDVVTFTSEPLDSPCIVAGPVQAALSISGGSGGVVVTTLSDVTPTGPVWNVADGVAAVTADSTTVSLGHAAHVFDVGHRIRLSVSFGSFPRFRWLPGDGYRTMALDRDTRLDVWTI